GRQRALHVAERLGNLVLDGVGKVEVIVPAALAGDLEAIADPDRLRVVQGLPQAWSVARRDEEFRLVHYCPSQGLSEEWERPFPAFCPPPGRVCRNRHPGGSAREPPR